MCVCVRVRAFSSAYVGSHQELHFKALIQFLLNFCLLVCPNFLPVVQFGWDVNVICGKKDTKFFDISLVHFKWQMMTLNQVVGFFY